MKGSIIQIVSSTENTDCEDYNPEEATQAITLAKNMLSQGMKPQDIAVITPFRKQVRALREAAIEILGDSRMLLIDTVERLQGQDVECIILSFAATNPSYINAKAEFLFDHNRLNVMISRGKSKVVIYGGKLIQERLKTTTSL